MNKYWATFKEVAKMRASSFFAQRFAAFIRLFSLTFSNLLQPLLIIFIYHSTKGLPGWSFNELLIFNATSMLSWGFATAFLFSMVWFIGWKIDHGEFDLLLLKPLRTIPLMIIESVNVGSLPSIITGLVILIISVVMSGAVITLKGLLAYTYLIGLSCLVYYGIAAVIIGLSFKFFKVHNFLHLFFTLSDFNKYPLNIYKTFIPFFLTFILPLALSSYYPASYLLGRITKPWTIITLSLVSLGFMVLGTTAIKYGLKHYSSAGG